MSDDEDKRRWLVDLEASRGNLALSRSILEAELERRAILMRAALSYLLLDETENAIALLTDALRAEPLPGVEALESREWFAFAKWSEETRTELTAYQLALNHCDMVSGPDGCCDCMRSLGELLHRKALVQETLRHCYDLDRSGRFDFDSWQEAAAKLLGARTPDAWDRNGMRTNDLVTATRKLEADL